MNYSKYEMSASTDAQVFEFESVGKNGTIEKIIQFSETRNPMIISLGFGDKKCYQDGSVNFDDKSDSNNGDRDMVLATVAMSVYEYTSQYSDRYITFSGSTSARTRLYRMAITKNYEELFKDYEIFGIIASGNNTILVPFEVNCGIEYLAFAVKRRKLINLQNSNL